MASRIVVLVSCASFGVLAMSCAVFNPESGTAIGDTTEPVWTSGLVPAPDRTVLVEIYNRQTKKWAIASTATSANEPTAVDKRGFEYFLWDITQPLLDGDFYWKQVGTSTVEARVRVVWNPVALGKGFVPLPTLDQGGR